MPLVAIATQQVIEWLIDLALKYGLVGSFVLSFLSNLILFMPVPYLSVVFWLSLHPPYGAGLDPISISLVSGLGAAIGKVVVYYIGAYGSRFLSEKKREDLDYMKKIISKYGPLAIFIFSATPLPDDILYFPLGIMRYNPLKFFFYCFLGKVVLTAVISVSGYYSHLLFQMVPFWEHWIRGMLMGESIWGIVLTVVLTVLVTVAILRIDWKKLIESYTSEKK